MMQFVAPYHLIPGGSFAGYFHPDHLADLRASGLNDDTIRAAGVYSIRPCDIAHFFGRGGVPEEVSSALCFPYQGREFARIKLFPSIKKRKYSQPLGTSARLYVPFPATADRLYICEGEKKTLAAHQMGLNAVGIGGIWNWLAQGQPIDDLLAVAWDGRDVSIVGDSDVWQRSELLRALFALGSQVSELGGCVDFLEIQQGGDSKVGLDDYLVGGGKISDLGVHSLGSNRMARYKSWHGGWKMNKVFIGRAEELKQEGGLNVEGEKAGEGTETAGQGAQARSDQETADEWGID